MAFPLHHRHRPRWLVASSDREKIAQLRVTQYSQTKSKARDEPNTSNSDRYESADRGMFVDARSKMFRQHLKCSMTEKLHQDVQEQAPDFFLFLFTQPAV